MHPVLTRSAMPALPRFVLGPWQFLYLVSIVFVFLPLLGIAMFTREIDEWYARVVCGPALERSLGFRTTRGPHPDYPGLRGESEYISYIEPGGAFDRAGFRLRDVPDRRCGVCTFSIYVLLEWNRGGSATIDVLRRPLGPRTEVHRVTLDVPVPALEQRQAPRVSGHHGS